MGGVWLSAGDVDQSVLPGCAMVRPCCAEAGGMDGAGTVERV